MFDVRFSLVDKNGLLPKFVYRVERVAVEGLANLLNRISGSPSTVIVSVILSRLGDNDISPVYDVVYAEIAEGPGKAVEPGEPGEAGEPPEPRIIRLPNQST